MNADEIIEKIRKKFGVFCSIKRISNDSMYFVSEDGDIFSTSKQSIKKLKQFESSRGYLSIGDAAKIIELLKSGNSTSKIHKMTKYTYAQIANIKKGKSFSNLTNGIIFPSYKTRKVSSDLTTIAAKNL